MSAIEKFRSKAANSNGGRSSDSGSPLSSSDGAYGTEVEGGVSDEEMDRIVEAVLARPSTNGYSKASKPWVGFRCKPTRKKDEESVNLGDDNADVNGEPASLGLMSTSSAPTPSSESCDPVVKSEKLSLEADGTHDDKHTEVNEVNETNEVNTLPPVASTSKGSIPAPEIGVTPPNADGGKETASAVKGPVARLMTEEEINAVTLSQSLLLMNEMKESLKSRRRLSSRKYSKMCRFVDACLKGCVHTVIYFLFKGYLCVNDELLCGMSGLQHACYAGQIDVVKALLEVGANPNYKRRADRFTPLMAAACFMGTETDGVVDCVKAVVAGGKIDVAQNDGMTALLFAASRRHLRMIEFFLDKGADLDHESIEGATAMKYAEQMEDETFKALLRRHMWVYPEPETKEEEEQSSPSTDP